MTTALDQEHTRRGFDVDTIAASKARQDAHLQDRATKAEHVAFIEEVKADLQEWHPDADAREIIKAYYAERLEAVRAKWLEIEYYGPAHTEQKNREEFAIIEAERAALATLQDQAPAPAQPVEDVRGRLLELASEARAVGDHKAETAALVEVLKADRREMRGEKAEAVLVVLLRTYVSAAVLAEQPPAWAEIDAALVALLPASTKADRRDLVARAGYGIARSWTNGSAGQLHLVELPAQDGEGELVESAPHTQKRTSG